MIRSKPLLAALCASAALLTGAAKPAPTPTPSNFVPALAYRYNAQEIRLANATGSQAVLLVRMPTSTVNNPVQLFSIAPFGQRRVAFIDHSLPGVRGLRFVTWTQSTPGGPLNVSLAPTQFHSTTLPSVYPSTVDFSPDGSKLALIENDYDNRATVLRFFDGATGAALGEPIPLAFDGHVVVRWQADGLGVWLLSRTKFSSYRDGVETSLFEDTTVPWFDPYNLAAPSIMLHKVVSGVGTLQRWDGALSGGAPLATTVVAGFQPSVSCDDARVIFQRGSPRAKTLLYNLQSNTEATFSQDSGITSPTYPSGCG